MSGFQTINPKALMRLIGTPNAPVIIDLRIPEDVATDARLIPGAIQHDYKDFPNLLNRLNGAPSVAVCHGGRKISHGIAAQLRANGLKSEVLEGGMLAWAEAALPAVPIPAIPAPHNGRTLWVTRHRPKVDRIACPWLIRRFVDPNASFMFVPPSEVADVASRFDATPFDVPDVPLTHKGENCTFDAMIATFNLSHPALDLLAGVVRAADTDQHKNAPQAAGLLAFSVGLSRQYKDDIAQLDAAMPLYDALYRWARDGADERHNTAAKVLS